MKTSTTVINGATVAIAGTDATGHTQVDLNALTVNDGTLHVKVTNGSTAPGAGKEIELFYAFSPNDQTTPIATSDLILGAGANRLVVKLDNTASAVREITTDKITLKVRYVIMWYKCRGLNATVTLTTAIQS